MERRRQRNGLVGLAVCVVTVLVFAGVAVWQYVDETAGSDRKTVAAFMAGLAVLFSLLTWYVFHKHWTAKLRGVTVSVTPTELRRGGQVQARVAGEGKGQLEVALVCTELYDVERTFTDGNGYQKKSRLTEAHVEYNDVRPLAMGSGEVTFGVPADGAFSYEGQAVSAIWSVRVTERRERRRDRRIDVPLRVAP